MSLRVCDDWACRFFNSENEGRDLCMNLLILNKGGHYSCHLRRRPAQWNLGWSVFFPLGEVWRAALDFNHYYRDQIAHLLCKTLSAHVIVAEIGTVCDNFRLAHLLCKTSRDSAGRRPELRSLASERESGLERVMEILWSTKSITERKIYWKFGAPPHSSAFHILYLFYFIVESTHRDLFIDVLRKGVSHKSVCSLLIQGLLSYVLVKSPSCLQLFHI